MTIGEQIKMVRNKRGYTQDELAAMVGMSSNTILNYEKDERDPKSQDLKAIAKALGVTTAFLMGEAGDPTICTKEGLTDNGKNITVANIGSIDATKGVLEKFPEIIDMQSAVVVPVVFSRELAAWGKEGILRMDMTSWHGETISCSLSDLGTSIDTARPPFAITAEDNSMSTWGISNGAKVIINPALEINNFDIALVCYHGKLAIKKLHYHNDSTVDLLAANGTTIRVPAADNAPESFSVYGKVIGEFSKVRHGM